MGLFGILCKVRFARSAAEEAEALVHRAEVIREIAERDATKADVIAVPNDTAIKKSRGGNSGVSGPAPASIRDLAKKTGRSEGIINRARTRR